MFLIPGPLWLIKKGVYVWGLLLALLHYTTPIQLTLIVQWYSGSCWPHSLCEQGASEPISWLANLLYHAYVVFMTAKPLLFFSLLLFSRIVVGLLSLQIYHAHSQQRPTALESLSPSHDILSAWIMMAGIYTALLSFLLSHILVHYHGCPNPPYNGSDYAYACEDTVISPRGMVYGGLSVLAIAILYLLVRIGLAQWRRKNLVVTSM